MAQRLVGPAFLLAAILAGCRAEQKHGIVFDAGSSGTRIHVYTWDSDASQPFKLISDDLLKIKPGALPLAPTRAWWWCARAPTALHPSVRTGLSSFRDDTAAAGASLNELLTYAYGKIPEEKRSQTPAYLMATAGLRLVGEQKTKEIFQSVCNTLVSSPFIFKCEWATLMSGFDEGLYGWVTVNYLKHTLDKGSSTTLGIIDLGGGSVQIVFEPSKADKVPADMKRALPLAGGTKTVYVKSHLGYGLDEARKSIAAVAAKGGQGTHPCMPIGTCPRGGGPGPPRLRLRRRRRAGPRRLQGHHGGGGHVRLLLRLR